VQTCDACGCEESYIPMSQGNGDVKGAMYT